LFCGADAAAGRFWDTDYPGVEPGAIQWKNPEWVTM